MASGERITSTFEFWSKLFFLDRCEVSSSFWQALPSWTLLECWLTCYIFQGATTVLSNAGRAAYFCHQTLEDAWHVINLQNWLCARVLSTDGDSDSLSLFSLPSSLIPQDIFWRKMLFGFKGKCVCDIDIVECGRRTRARFLLLIDNWGF